MISNKMTLQEEIDKLLSQPNKLLTRRPFTRGACTWGDNNDGNEVNVQTRVLAQLPEIKKIEVSEETFLKELDPNSHKVLFDENIPSIHQKLSNGSYQEIVSYRTPLPIQKCIKNKQVMHLAANKMQFTLMDIEPNDTQQRNFITFKHYWDLRNQDGMKYKMVDTQKSVGKAGLLYYFNRKKEIKSRILSYPDFILCSHNDANGERLLECVYYKDDYGIETIDCYDDTYIYTLKKNIIDNKTESEWEIESKEEHGFKEIPLITKTGEVAWNDVQTLIESYEELYNVFMVIQKRWGWGILYVKGKFKNESKKIAGSVVLEDSSIDGNGDARFLTPPTPQGTIDTLNMMMESIQLGSSTTFILPKDIRMSGDVSGIAVQLTQSQDNELALQNVIDWQNVADKMVRLFKYGLAKELVSKGINTMAMTEFDDLQINAKFKVWRPLNEYEYNQMVTTLVGAGVISKETGIEINTLSKPDEKIRVENELQSNNNNTKSEEVIDGMV